MPRLTVTLTDQTRREVAKYATAHGMPSLAAALVSLAVRQLASLRDQDERRGVR